jgi:hairy-and-enhancer-of-split protein
MNWQNPFSAFSPRVSSTTAEATALAVSSSSSSELESSPEFQKATGHMTLSSPGSDSDVPLSRTHQYKKITKPLLERKRRARINKCLDELKDIMTVALQAEGENVSKLEKADILELTVRHLHKLNQSRRLLVRNPLEDLQKFQAGYSSCAQEAATFLLTTPGVDVRLSQRLLGHLSSTAGPAMAANMVPLSLNLPAVPHLARRFSPPPSPQLTYPASPRPGGPKVSEPPEPSPAPSSSSASSVPLTVTQGSFTLSIRRQTPEPLSERSQNEKSVPVRPAAIRLNPGRSDSAEPVWRPYSSTT